MASWNDVTIAAPALAKAVQGRFEATGLGILATLRKDGSPRVSGVEPLFAVGELWLGSMPALLKAFLEQVFRPGFAFSKTEAGKTWKKSLTGKSARIVVTMGMPAFVYRWYFGAHSLKRLERNILGFCGIGPIKESLIGMVEAKDGGKREKWLEKIQALGREGK